MNIDEIMHTEPLRAGPTRPISLHDFIGEHKQVWFMLQHVNGLEVGTVASWARVVAIDDNGVTFELQGGTVTLTRMAGTVNEAGTGRFMEGHLTLEVR